MQRQLESEDEYLRLEEICKQKDGEIRVLLHEKVYLEEKIEDINKSTKSTKGEGKGYNMDMRMMVFDAITDQVPAANIQNLISKFAMRCGLTLSDIPHRTTVERMKHELGAIAEMQTAEVILSNENTALGFDAITEEGIHVNSIHVTTNEKCYVVVTDELPDGRADDYSTHIVEAVDSLASVYSVFHWGQKGRCEGKYYEKHCKHND